MHGCGEVPGGKGAFGFVMDGKGRSIHHHPEGQEST